MTRAAKKDKVVHISHGKTEPREPSTDRWTGMRPFEEMERMFESMMPRGLMHPSRWDFPMLGEWSAPFERRLLPRVDIIEHDTEVVLRAQIPGVDKKDLNVTVTDNMVTLEGETSHETTAKEADYFRRECTHGTFMRQIPLPSDVDGAKAKATFSDGILELTMPKLARTTRHKVNIA